MKTAILLVILGILIVSFALIDLSLTGEDTYKLPYSVNGIVVGAKGPIEKAIVQVQGTPNKVITRAGGHFSLKGLGGILPLTLTAWADGHYIGWTSLDPQSMGNLQTTPITITLKPLFETDNLAYDWFSFEGVEGSASCGLCHREYDEWLADAHSKSAVNPRFISIYRGTDIHGEESQPIRWDRDGNALPPDPALPFYGPGYRLDNPQRAGNCATCHTPMASKISNQNNCGWSGCHTDLTAERAIEVDDGVIPLHLTGDAAEGIGCDFCHKIGEVTLEPETRLPFPDKPGILSMHLYRPEDGEQVFFGTLVDVSRRVSYSPLLSQSEYCAPCHYGVFGGVVGHNSVSGGVVIYNSYGEWLESAYSDPESGQTCQDCHMRVLDIDYAAYPEKGGIRRSYASFHEHYMPGAADEQLLQNSVTLNSQAQHQQDRLLIDVNITNDQVGHHIPTDAPMRQMILVVEAIDTNGKLLPLVEGFQLPNWAGDYASKPGKVFAKILRDEWTGETPTAAYWRPVSIVEDTRLPALATDTSQFVFSLAPNETAEIRVRLFFRRSFYELAKQKGWDDPDILMEEIVLHVEKSR